MAADHAQAAAAQGGTPRTRRGAALGGVPSTATRWIPDLDHVARCISYRYRDEVPPSRYGGGGFQSNNIMPERALAPWRDTVAAWRGARHRITLFAEQIMQDD